MTLSKQPYKGARDFYPEEKRLQKYIFDVMRQVVEKFGYEEYDAPLLEPLELYAAKTGDEIVNEQTYTFEDRGGRKVAIRPEMTPSVSRMVAAKRQELAYPLRWYSIPVNWRYERPQRGRLREFWQLNIDLFGVAGIEAEDEMIVVADAIMQAFGVKRSQYTIKLNSRKLVDGFLREYLKLDETQSQAMGKLIDRLRKISKSDFEASVDSILTPAQRKDGTAAKLFEALESEHINDLPQELYEHSSVAEIKRLIGLLETNGIRNVEFDFTIMRGFDYYTDVVFEVFDTNPENNRSMFGGGRYDGLVGLFGVDPVPTVGFGMGDVTLTNFLQLNELMPQVKTETDIYVVTLGDVFEGAQEALSSLRAMGVNVAVDMTHRKPAAKIKSAVKKGIKWALFIGEKELSGGQFTLRNLDTGKEAAYSLKRVVDTVKSGKN